MLKVKYIKKLATELLGLPIYLLSTLSVRSEKVMVFGEWHGRNYCDNSKYLFEYVSDNHKDQEAVWITKDKDIKNLVIEKGYKCEYAYSVKGFYYCFRAKYAFVTHDSADVNQYLLGKCKLINLTHGTPLKRMGADANYLRLGRFTYFFDKYLEQLIPSKKKVDILFCADDKASVRFQSSYEYPVEIIVSGYPRWKGLYEKNSCLNGLVQNYDKVISYLPTLRFNNHTQIDPFSFGGFDDLCRYIERRNYLLIIRPHPVMTFPNENVFSKNIVFIKSEDVRDVNEVLQVTDILISDYSSVIYDFEQTGKEILLLSPDSEVYINEDVGVYGNYYKDFQWPIVSDWFGVLNSIDSIAFKEHLPVEGINNAAYKIINHFNNK